MDKRRKIGKANEKSKKRKSKKAKDEKAKRKGGQKGGKGCPGPTQGSWIWTTIDKYLWYLTLWKIWMAVMQYFYNTHVLIFNAHVLMFNAFGLKMPMHAINGGFFGGAICIGHYDVTDDVITQKL